MKGSGILLKQWEVMCLEALEVHKVLKELGVFLKNMIFPWFLPGVEIWPSLLVHSAICATLANQVTILPLGYPMLSRHDKKRKYPATQNLVPQVGNRVQRILNWCLVLSPTSIAFYVF